MSPSKKQSSSESSHAVNLIDLHTLVAEPSDVSHGTVKQESLMDDVGRNQARRGQPVDKPGTRSVRYRDRETDQHRGKDRERLSRGKELDTDTNADMDMNIETDQLGLFNQELKDCVDESRRVSIRSDNRFERGSEYGLECVYTQNEKCCVRVLGNQLGVDNRECERRRVQMVHTSVALNKSNASADNAVFRTGCGKRRHAM